MSRGTRYDPLDHCKLCIAIDFGTAGTGLAYASIPAAVAGKRRPPPVLADVKVINKWPTQVLHGEKTKTSLLLDDTGAFKAFGDEAENKMYGASEDTVHGWKYFKEFKMKLFNKSDLLGLQISPSNDELELPQNQVPALTVFSKALRYVAGFAIQQVNDIMAGTLYTAEDVYWVLTVPAIWKEGAKAFMMQAATMAHLSSNPLHIEVAREPEAASLFCRLEYLPNLPPSARWIVLDCGGGTIDAVIHQLEKDGKNVREVCKSATANASGSTVLDKSFKKLLADLLGKQTFKDFLVQNHKGALQLNDKIEKAKNSIVEPPPEELPTMRYVLDLPAPLTKFMTENVDSDLEDLAEEFNERHESLFAGADLPAIVVDDTSLRISYQCVRTRIYDKVLNSIGELLEELLASTEKQPGANGQKGVGYVFVVGNFANSKFLETRLRSICAKHRVQMVLPVRPGNAIALGAVLYGLDPSVIKSRLAPCSYFISFATEYDEEVHVGREIVTFAGQDHVMMLRPYLLKGQVIESGLEKRDNFHPLNDNTTTVSISMYQSDQTDSQYPTDPTVFKAASIRLDLGVDSSEMGASQRRIDVVMTFGSASIRVRAVDVHTGSDVDAAVAYLEPDALTA